MSETTIGTSMKLKKKLIKLKLHDKETYETVIRRLIRRDEEWKKEGRRRTRKRRWI